MSSALTGTQHTCGGDNAFIWGPCCQRIPSKFNKGLGFLRQTELEQSTAQGADPFLIPCPSIQ